MKNIAGGSDVIVPANRIIGETNEGSDGTVVHAVTVRNAIKVYGSKDNRCAVLDGLNMTIKKGAM